MDMNQRLNHGARYAWAVTVKWGIARMDLMGETVGNGETVAQAKEAVRVFAAGRMGAPSNVVEIVTFQIDPC